MLGYVSIRIVPDAADGIEFTSGYATEIEHVRDEPFCSAYLPRYVATDSYDVDASLHWLSSSLYLLMCLDVATCGSYDYTCIICTKE